MAGSASAGRRYAKALFRIAQEDGSVDQTRQELADLAGLFDTHPELRDCLFRPLHPVAQRRGVVQSVASRLGSSETVKSFYSFLVDQRRLVDFPAIRSEFDRLADEAAGRTEARVVSANPLNDADRERITRALSARTGLQVGISVEVDPSLIGGLVAQVGDLVFDGSLRTQLQQLRANLTKG